MARYIDAERLKRTFASGIRVYDGMCKIDDILHNIENEPTARVIEVPNSFNDTILTAGRLFFEENLSIEEIANRTYYSPRQVVRHILKFKEGIGLKDVKFGKIRRNSVEKGDT